MVFLYSYLSCNTLKHKRSLTMLVLYLYIHTMLVAVQNAGVKGLSPVQTWALPMDKLTQPGNLAVERSHSVSMTHWAASLELRTWYSYKWLHWCLRHRWHRSRSSCVRKPSAQFAVQCPYPRGQFMGLALGSLSNLANRLSLLDLHHLCNRHRRSPLM